MINNQFRFRKDLQQLLSAYGIDMYTGLDSYTLSGLIVGWINQQASQQNKTWKWDIDDNDRQQRYHEYILKNQREDNNEL